MASGCSLGWLPFLLDRDKSLVLAEISESREDRKNCLYIFNDAIPIPKVQAINMSFVYI